MSNTGYLGKSTPNSRADQTPKAEESAQRGPRSSDPVQSDSMRRGGVPGFNDPLPERPSRPPAGMDQQRNYVVTVGLPSSGKSTLQRHLLLYLRQAGHHMIVPAPRQGVQQDFDSLEQKWRRQLQLGEFPVANPVGTLTDFRFDVKPRRYFGPKLPFGFLEVSGEDYRTLIDPDQQIRTLDSVDPYLRDPNISLSFLFVTQGKEVEDDDILFRRFLDYLQEHVPHASQHCSAAVVLANPDMCYERLRRIREVRGEKEPAHFNPTAEARNYVQTIMPETETRLKGEWGKRAAIAVFSVGRLENVRDNAGEVMKDRDGRPVKRIANPDFDDAQALFDWLYKQFTGKSLGPGLLARLLAWIKGDTD